MTKYTGKGVYGAVAMGKISVFKKQDTAIKRIHTEDSEGEKKRVAKAKQAATEQLQSFMTRHSGRWAKQTLRSLRYT